MAYLLKEAFSVGRAARISLATRTNVTENESGLVGNNQGHLCILQNE